MSKWDTSATSLKNSNKKDYIILENDEVDSIYEKNLNNVLLSDGILKEGMIGQTNVTSFNDIKKVSETNINTINKNSNSILDAKHGKVRIVGIHLKTSDYLEFKYIRQRKLYRVIVSGDREKPLFTAAGVFSKPHHITKIWNVIRRSRIQR